MGVFKSIANVAKKTGHWIYMNKGPICHYAGGAMMIGGTVLCTNAGRWIDTIMAEHRDNMDHILKGRECEELTAEEKKQARLVLLGTMKKFVKKFGIGVAVLATGAVANEFGHKFMANDIRVLKGDLAIAATAYAELWKTYNDYKTTVEEKMTPEQIEEIDVEVAKKKFKDQTGKEAEVEVQKGELEKSFPVGAGPLSFWITPESCPNLFAGAVRKDSGLRLLKLMEQEADNKLHSLPIGGFLPASQVLNTIDYQFRGIPAMALVTGWFNDGKTHVDFRIDDCKAYRIMCREETPDEVEDDPEILIDLNARGCYFAELINKENPYSAKWQASIEDPKPLNE